MAGLREIAKEYRDEIMDGIAWVAIWKTGKSWNAKDFWLDMEFDKIKPEEMSEARDIVAEDENAIFINEYYCAHMGNGSIQDIVAGIKGFYENGYNTLKDSSAYEPGEDFRKQERKEQISEIIKGINEEDENWQWEFSVKRTEIRMHWEYIKDEPYDFFRIIYNEEYDCFLVYTGLYEDITEELEDTTSLQAVMRSVF